MTLRNKVVGTLGGVFVLYVLATWLVLRLVHTPVFENIERNSAVDQINRVREYIKSERDAVELLVIDWAQWDDLMEYVQGEYDDFYTDNLEDGYLSDLGMNFGAIFDSNNELVWGEAYLADGSIAPLDAVFPDGIVRGSPLLSPENADQLVSGLINTAKGPAIISSAAILWSSGEGPAGGHVVLGELLNAGRMETISRTMLSVADVLPVEENRLPDHLTSALNELIVEGQSYSTIKQDKFVFALTLLRDISDQPLGLLRVAMEADISALGAHTLKIMILTLVLAALVVTAALWMVLKGSLLMPIENLTAVLRGQGEDRSADNSGRYLVSTVNRLAESRGSASRRSDEIGELITAFVELGTSLKEATTSVWRAAHLDGLTGLANRRMFLERLAKAIDTATESSEFAVLFIDLDDFKIVNDTLGHDAGDQLLIDVASRIRSIVGTDTATLDMENGSTGNLVGRIGGDEFVVLLEKAQFPEYAHEVAEKIVARTGSPFVIEGEQCHIGACVGLAIFPEDSKDLDGVLAKADAAMYEAKRAGKNSWRPYVPGLSRVSERTSA